MPRGQRFNRGTRGLFGILAVFIAGMFGVAIGQRMGGTNPFDVFDYAVWSLVVLAIVLDFLAVNLIVWQVQKIRAGKMDSWEDWVAFIIVCAIAVIMFIGTMWTWSQHLFERFLSWASSATTIQWFDTGNISDTRSKVCGMVAFVIVIGLTNWIWHHPLWRGRARDVVQVRDKLSRRERRAQSVQ